MSKYVTVVIKYEGEEASFGYGMQTEDLPEGDVVAVQFGNALADDEDDQP